MLAGIVEGRHEPIPFTTSALTVFGLCRHEGSQVSDNRSVYQPLVNGAFGKAWVTERLQWCGDRRFTSPVPSIM